MQVSEAKPAQLIRGGPGSGKTRCLAEAVVEAVGEGISPARILWLTLDRAAQRRQRDQLTRRSVEAGRSVIPVIETYEDIAQQILDESLRHGGRGIIRPLCERLLVGEIIREVTFSARYYRAEAIRTSPRFRDDVADFIAELKRYKIDARTFRDEIIPQLPQGNALADLADIYERYQQRLREADTYDLRGIIWLALLALEDEQLATSWQNRWDLIVADDLQDATVLQIELLAALCGPQAGLVGAYEPAESIYRFRGAVSEPTALLAALLPGRLTCQRLPADQPGRMAAQIAGAARRFAGSEQLEAAPVGQRSGDGDVSICVYRTLTEELTGIGDQIIQLLEAGDCPPEQIAVITRAREQQQAVRSHLALREIPVADHQAESAAWTARNLLAQILQLLVYVRERNRYPAAQRRRELAAVNLAAYRLLSAAGADDLQLAELFHRCQQQQQFMLSGQHDDYDATLSQWTKAASEAAATDEPLTAMRLLLDRTGLIGKIAENMPLEVVGALASVLEDLQEANDAFRQVAGQALSFQQGCSIVQMSRPAQPSDDSQGIQVLLAHDARGLECEVVYLVGLTDGAFPAPPMTSSLLAPEALAGLRRRVRERLDVPVAAVPFARFGESSAEARAEEARLFYTCLTRARRKLVVSCHLEKDGAQVGPSQFLASILPDNFVLGPLDEQREANFTCVFWGLARQASGGRTSHEGCPVAPCAGRRPEPERRTGERITRWRSRPNTKPILADLAPDWSLSASSIDRYLGCPRRFFFEKLLGLPEEDHEGMVYGRLLHQVMALLNQLPPTDRSAEQAINLLSEVLSSYRNEFGSPYSLQAYRRRAQQALEAYATTDEFGEQSLAREQSFQFELADDHGQPHIFRGRVDQVAPADEGGVEVIDYKSGEVDSPAAVRRSFCYRDQDTAKEPARKHYQLPLYTLWWQAAHSEDVRRMCLQSLDPEARQPLRRSCVSLEGEEPDSTCITRDELQQIAARLGSLARTIKQRPGFEGHPPRDGCTARHSACPYVLICTEAEPS